jgi:aldehyde:ferredoxin oxidoreductase
VHGFYGCLLHVDLTSGQTSYANITEARLRAFLGGIGLTTHAKLYEPSIPCSLKRGTGLGPF